MQYHQYHCCMLHSSAYIQSVNASLSQFSAALLNGHSIHYEHSTDSWIGKYIYTYNNHLTLKMPGLMIMVVLQVCHWHFEANQVLLKVLCTTDFFEKPENTEHLLAWSSIPEIHQKSTLSITCMYFRDVFSMYALENFTQSALMSANAHNFSSSKSVIVNQQRGSLCCWELSKHLKSFETYLDRAFNPDLAAATTPKGTYTRKNLCIQNDCPLSSQHLQFSTNLTNTSLKIE